MKHLIFVMVVSVFLSGCAGIGRAWDQTWYGTPPEVVESIQFMNDTMLRELEEKYEAIEESDVTNPDGTINKQAAQYRFRDMETIHAQMERWKQLCKALADYIGFNLEDDPTLSQKEALKRRQEFWEAIYKLKGKDKTNGD